MSYTVVYSHVVNSKFTKSKRINFPHTSVWLTPFPGGNIVPVVYIYSLFYTLHFKAFIIGNLQHKHTVNVIRTPHLLITQL